MAQMGLLVITYVTIYKKKQGWRDNLESNTRKKQREILSIIIIEGKFVFQSSI